MIMSMLMNFFTESYFHYGYCHLYVIIIIASFITTILIIITTTIIIIITITIIIIITILPLLSSSICHHHNHHYLYSSLSWSLSSSLSSYSFVLFLVNMYRLSFKLCWNIIYLSICILIRKAKTMMISIFDAQ